jgi:hypothetical protein
VQSSGIIDLAIGLIFAFGITAALSSAVTELIARFLGLRGAYLLTGLRELLEGSAGETDLAAAKGDYDNTRTIMRGSTARAASPAAHEPSVASAATAKPAPQARPSATGALLGGPILGSQGMAGQFSSRKLTVGPAKPSGRLPKMTVSRETAPAGQPGVTAQAGGVRSQCRSLPSYISSRSFADAVIDLLVPDPAGPTTMFIIQQNVNALPESMAPFQSSLQALVKDAGHDVSQFRTGVEHWYDDHMDRVSGWYKRYVAKITLAVGAILIVLLNINALTIGRTLYTESAVSAAISTVAAKGTNCSDSQTQQACLANLQAQLSAAATAGLPIGWGTVRDCTKPGAPCNWLDQRGIFSRHGNSGWQLVLVLIGFLIMIIALVPGAQFWFGLLSKIGSLRATGPKPAPAGS